MVLEMGNSPDALSPIYQKWNPCQLLKKPDWTDALSNLVLPFISINYNHVAFAGFIFINISSNKQKNPQMPSYKGKLPQAQWYKLDMSQDWHDLFSTYPALGSETGWDQGFTLIEEKGTSCVDSRLSVRLCSTHSHIQLPPWHLLEGREKLPLGSNQSWLNQMAWGPISSQHH